MNRKAVSGMMLTLLLISMLTSASSLTVHRVEAELATWTVDDDGPADFPTIWEGINGANLRGINQASMKRWSMLAIDSGLEEGLGKRLMDVSWLPFEASGRWGFENEVEWGDFACVDDDSAELVIGLGDVRPNGYSELADITMSNGGELVDTVSMDGKISAVVANIPHVSMSAFVSEIEVAGLSRYVEPNMRFEIDFVPNDPDWPKQWGAQKIEADYAWNTQTGDPSVLVAVIDTGIDWNHPDLAANYVPLGYDWVNNDPDPMDDHGHGTHCAGVIAAVLNNGIGIAGLAQVQIMAQKGLDSRGSGRSDELANAIVHAVAQGADIISCSWGSYARSTVVHEAMKYAYDQGVLVIGAAGNDATDIKHYPAAYYEVVAVTASDESDNPAEFTNFGDWVEVAAPGVHIYSTVWDDSYVYMSGTSMSAPHVSGVAALIWSQFPSMTRDQVRTQLQYTANDLGDLGFDVYYGYGRINARRAVEQAPSNHDVLVLSWKKPRYVNLGSQGTINSTILNMGASDESGITVQLLVNDSVVDSKIVSSLVSGASASVSCLWVPTVKGVYNVTSYVVAVLGETVTKNNALSASVQVRIPKVVRVPDDYETIQDAIDGAIEGDTIFVASGTYHEAKLWVSKEGLTLVGEDVNSTIIEGAEYVVVAADNVNVNGFTFQNGDIGIATYYSKGSIINNTRTLNNEIGIYLLSSASITLINNNMTDNSNNLDVDGYSLSDFIHEIDTSNTVNGKPVYYWINEHDKQVPSDAGYVAAVNSTKIVIKDLDLADNGEGVLLVGTTNSVIENVNASNSYYGVYLAHSSANTFSGCFAANNSNGIYLYESIDNNISHSIVIDNKNGIRSYYSSDNEISFNKALKNDFGVLLEKSNDNIIDTNEVTNNTYGVYVKGSCYNVLRNNNMTRNDYNFGVAGSHLSHFVQDIVTSNTVNDKPVYYWLNQKDREIPADAGFVAVVNSTNIAVRGLSLTNNVNGVLFVYTSESLIENVNATNNTYAIFLYSSSNNTIVGNTVTSKNRRGIQLIGSNNNTVGNNRIADNYISVGLWLSAENNAISNNVISNGTVGLYLDHSGSNSISNNTVINKRYRYRFRCGIKLYCSGDNTLRNNNMTGNEWNFGVYGGSLSNFIQDIDTSNNVDGKPMYYWVNQHSKTIPADAGYVAAVNSTRVTVKNLNLANNLQGVMFAYTTNSAIMNVIASDNYYGVYLWVSENNTISGNNIANNWWDGIALYLSDGNTIISNTVTETAGAGIDVIGSHMNVIDKNIILEHIIGIMVEYSDYNILSGNKVTGGAAARLHGLTGIALTESKGNVLSGNAVSGNRFFIGAGISLEQSSNNNTIVQNTLENNEYGVTLEYLAWLLGFKDQNNNNTIYHNNFNKNTNQVLSLYSLNTWDNGYPSGGNYWSDHVCTGNPSDGSQPYIIDAGNIDHYPFQDPDGWLLHQLTVTSSPTTGITFTINGVPETTPYTEWLLEGSYTLEMPESHNGYVWSHWLEDGDTNRTKTITLPSTMWTGVYVPPFDVYTQKEPYSGKGPNQPSDAFAPQEEVTLYAYVSYHGDPVANKLVAFQVNDSTGETYLYRTNSTDENGIATTSFRIPSTPIFGEWTVYATVDIAEKTVNDTLTFKVGWIVEITAVETVDTYGASKTSFAKGEHVHFNVTVQNIAFTSKTTTLTIAVYDECGVPIGQVTLQNWSIGPGRPKIFTIDLQIPKWAYLGVATIYANAYTDMSQNGGTPYCPEAYATFMITRT